MVALICIRYYIILYWNVIYFQGMVVNGLLSVVITSIERRFDLKSTETGFIASSYDMACVLCLIPVGFIYYIFYEATVIITFTQSFIHDLYYNQ